MLKKLFGGKKEEFFIQLDESKIPAAPASQHIATNTEAETPPAPSTEVKTEVATAPKSKKKSVKKSSPKASVPPAETVTPAPRPEPVQVEFATQYLITQSLVRRQPGPSLNKFKEMARQVKTR